MKESLPTSSSPREEVSFEARLPWAASWSIFPLGIAMHFLFSGWLFESCDAPLRLVGLMLARNMVLFGWVLLVLPPNGRRLPGVFGPPSTFEGRELTLLTVWGSLVLGIGLELLGRSLISFAPFDILPIAWPGAGAAILWLALLIIVAPAVEELVFRACSSAPGAEGGAPYPPPWPRARCLVLSTRLPLEPPPLAC